MIKERQLSTKLTEAIRLILAEELAIISTKKIEIDKLHKVLTSETVNDFRLKCFRKINRIVSWKDLLKEVIWEDIRPILGMDLAIQKNLNLSIQMPEDESSVLGKHEDYMSGDSPFQRVIWLPITRAFETNAMHIQDAEGKYLPVEVEEDEYLIFDPNTLHGNILNKTDHTRISVNIRVKNWFAPDMGDLVPDRQFGIYYENFTFSESTQRAFAILSEALSNE